MSRSLDFTVVNSQIVSYAVDVEVDGVSAVAHFDRAVVEAVPVDKAGKTFTAVLPPEALSEFPEGSALTITIAANQEA